MALLNHGTSPTHDPDERAEALESGWQLDGPKPEPVIEEAPAEESSALVDVMANAVEIVKSNVDTRNAQAVAAEAWQAYQEGEYDPGELADHLLATNEAAASQFAQLWAQEEEAFDYPEESEALAWIVSRDNERQRFEQAAASAQAYAAEQQREQQRLDGLAQAAETFRLRHPDADAASIRERIQNLFPEGAPDGDAALVALESSHRLDANERKARLDAELQAEFDEHLHSERLFHGEAVGEFDRETAILQNQLRNLARMKEEAAKNPVNLVTPVPTRSDQATALEAQIEADLFHEERVRSAGWNMGGDVGRAKTEELARKMGMSPLDPKVQQIARKRNWLP